jgi:hypothetical protein
MKKTLKTIALICGIFLTGSLYAQGPGPGQHWEGASADEKSEKISEKLDVKLDLNEEQKVAVKKAYYDFFLEMDEAREEHRLKMKALHEENAAIRDTEIEKSLTETQYEEYLKLRDEMREEFRHRMKKRRH